MTRGILGSSKIIIKSETNCLKHIKKGLIILSIPSRFWGILIHIDKFLR